MANDHVMKSRHFANARLLLWVIFTEILSRSSKEPFALRSLSVRPDNVIKNERGNGNSKDGGGHCY